MQEVDITRIINDANLDRNTLADKLFPKLKHPKQALKCVEDGTQLLNSDQLLILANLSNRTVSDLYSIDGWKHEKLPEFYTFTKDDFSVTLNLDDFTTRVYENGTMKIETVLTRSSIPLSEYVNQIETLIKNSKK